MYVNKKKSTGAGIKIALIDSGVDRSHPLLKDMQFSSKSISVISNTDGSIFAEQNIQDTNDICGHGTAICGIFAKLIPNAEITIIKIFDSMELTATKEQLMTALAYVENDLECDIVHMSFGTIYYSAELEVICKNLIQNGIILVSAYDNAGAISFPAAFPDVIAVESDTRCRFVDEFMLIEDCNRITVLAKGGNHRLAWVDSSYVINQGSSFSAGYITAYLAQNLSCDRNNSNDCHHKDVRKILRAGAKKAICLNETPSPNLTKIPFQMRSAIIFPYNKEMHSLINYKDQVQFSIQGICDTKYSGLVGQTAKSIDNRFEFIIGSIESMDWEKADTLILGHTDEINGKIGSDTRDTLLKLCLDHGLNVYAFDDSGIDTHIDEFLSKNLNIYVPTVNSVAHLKGYRGKLFHIDKPLLGIFGTSSKQGKFTLQLALRRSFKEAQYQVCQLGTEPSSLLFGFDACFPFGYNSTVRLNGESFILEVNALIHEIVINDPEIDIVITGCQSGTTPMLYNNIGQIPIEQLNFLIASMPDAVILCVNPDDDLEYICRSIQTIEGLGDCLVIALALYPLSYQNGWNIMNNFRRPISNRQEIVERLQEQTGKRVFIIGDKSETDRLRDTCIEYLSE